MVAIRQIFVLCLFMGLVKASFFRRIHKNNDESRKSLAERFHPRLNLRNYLHRPDRFQNRHLNSDKFTRHSNVVSYIPSEDYESGFFDPISFNGQNFNPEIPELEDSTGNLKEICEYCGENYQNTDFKFQNSEEFDGSEKYNTYYDNILKNQDGLESYKKLKAFLYNSLINKPQESNDDFVKGKDKLIINKEIENAEFDYFPKVNGESNLNKLKTNTDSTDVDNNRNSKSSIVSEAFEEPKEANNNLISDQILDCSGNNQPSPLPLSYPPYLYNFFGLNGSPLLNILPSVNGAQYNNQPFLSSNVSPNSNNQLPAFVSNDNVVPMALSNVDSAIPNSYTILAIPNNGYTGTNGLDFINSPLYQNPYSKQQSYVVVKLQNGQNALLPSNYVQMPVRNNRQEDGQNLIPTYDQISVTSNGKNIPLTKDNGKLFVSDNSQQTLSNDADGQNLSPNVFGKINQKTLSDIFRKERIQNTQVVQKLDQNPLQFRSLGESVPSSSGNNNTLLIIKQETEPSDENKKNENDKLVFI